MKSILSLILIAFITLSFSSCTKDVPNGDGQNPFVVPTDNGTGTEPEPTLPVGDVPASFTQKAVIEKITGEWCGACPSGSTEIDGIMAANPGKVIAVEFHMANSDPFEIPNASAIRSHLTLGASMSSFSFPSASINRTQRVAPSSYPDECAYNTNATGVWAGRTSTALGQTAVCGLALDVKEENDQLSVDVYIGHNAPVTAANTKLTVYLVENNVPESSPGAQVSGGGNYLHKHVLRDVLTADIGNDVNIASTSEKHTLISLANIDISGKYLNKNNVSVVAFINAVGADGGKHGILNAQEANLNEIKGWD